MVRPTARLVKSYYSYASAQVQVLALAAASSSVALCQRTPHNARALCLATMPNTPQHPARLKEELDRGDAALLDVREAHEHDAASLKQATLVPLSMLQEGQLPRNLDIDNTKTTYLHCAAGIRVHYAAPLLQEMGFERVVPLQEGFAALAAAGFEVR